MRQWGIAATCEGRTGGEAALSALTPRSGGLFLPSSGYEWLCSALWGPGGEHALGLSLCS